MKIHPVSVLCPKLCDDHILYQLSEPVSLLFVRRSQQLPKMTVYEVHGDVLKSRLVLLDQSRTT